MWRCSRLHGKKFSTKAYAWGGGSSMMSRVMNMAQGRGKDETKTMGETQLFPQTFLPELDIKHIGYGKHHAAIVTEEGKICTYGSGKYHELGVGAKTIVEEPVELTNVGSIRFKQVECGERHTIALSEDGDVYTCGWAGNVAAGNVTSYGALGQGGGESGGFFF